MTLNRQRLLRYTEYAAVSASIVGAIAAIATRQLIYAVVPLCTVAVLNIANRRQWEQQIEQRLTQNITQVDEQLGDIARQSHQLETRVNYLGQQQSETRFAKEEDLRSFRRGLTQLVNNCSQEIETLKDAVTRSTTINADLQQTQSAFASELQQRLNEQVRALETQESNREALLDNRVGEIRTEFSQLVSDINQLRDDLTELRLRFRDWESSPVEDLVTPDTVPEESALPPPEPLRWQSPQLLANQDATLEINLGIDFGTGFTKVCFRDLASDRSEVVTFADLESSDILLDQALLPTRVIIQDDGTLLTGLTLAEWEANSYPVKTSLEFIKMRLAHIDLPEQPEWRLEKIPELDEPETVEHICAYYLSHVIKRSQDWIQQHSADLFKNQTVHWSLNVGVPVEYCDSPALERFERVLRLAWLMANTPSSERSFNLSELNQFGSFLREWLQQNLEQALDCFTTPEISAAVWSFLSSREAQEKFYTFFDVGEGTLDGAAFRFWRENDGDRKVDFFAGAVRSLGVTAFTQQLASELAVSSNEVCDALRAWRHADHNHEEIYSQIKKSRTYLRFQRLIAAVVIVGKNKQQDNLGRLLSQEKLGQNLEVFLGGGGGQNLFIQNIVQSTHEDFQHERAGVPKYKMQSVPKPKGLEMNGLNTQEFHRFSVAYGLCTPQWEGPEIRLPSQIETQDDDDDAVVVNKPEKYFADTKD